VIEENGGTIKIEMSRPYVMADVCGVHVRFVESWPASIELRIASSATRQRGKGQVLV
jgi:hypothetical protein